MLVAQDEKSEVVQDEENEKEAKPTEVLQWITNGQPLQLGVASDFQLFSTIAISKEQLPNLPKSDSHRLRWGSITTGETSSGQSGVLIHVQAISNASGHIDVPPLSIAVDSQTLLTPALKLKVDPAITSEDMSFEVIAPSGNLFVGEGFLLECHWTTTLQLSAIEALHIELPIARDPRFKVHFPAMSTKNDSNEIGLPIESQRVIGHWKKVLHQGEPAHTITFQMILSAQKSGKHHFDGPSLFCSVPKKIPKLNSKTRWKGMTYPSYFNNSFFDKNSSSSQFVRLTTRAKPFVIHALPLPTQGRPEHFSGYIGKPSLQLIPMTQQLVEGESFECHLAITSSTLIPPEPPPLDDHSAYVHNFSWPDSDLQTLTLGDSQLYRFQLTPLHAELEQIPPLLLHCFDPETQTYITVRSNSPAVQVTPARDPQNAGLPDWFSQSSPPQHDNTGVWSDHWGALPTQTTGDVWLWRFIWFTPPFGFLLFIIQLWITRIKKNRRPSSHHQRALSILKYWPTQQNVDLERELHTLLLSILREQGYPLQVQGYPSPAIPVEVRVVHEFNAWLNQKHDPHHQHSDGSVRDPHPPRPQELIASLKNMAKAKPTRGNFWSLFGLVVFSLLLCPSMVMGEPSTNVERSEALLNKNSEFMALSHLAHQTSLSEPHRGKELHRQLALKIEELIDGQKNLKVTFPAEYARLAFNAGNHWLQAEQLGQALLWYQRASRISPHFPNLQHNLNIARQRRQDDLPFGFKSNVVYTTLSPYLGFLKILFALVNLYVFLLLGKHIWLRTAATSLICSLGALWCGVGAIYGFTSWDQCQHQPDGVIISSSVVARKGPSPIFAPAFTAPLHHGTEIIVLEEQELWTEVRFSDQSEGWLPTRSLERF